MPAVQVAGLFGGQVVRVKVEEDVCGRLVVVPEGAGRVGEVASGKGRVEEVEGEEEEEEEGEEGGSPLEGGREVRE